MAALRDLGTVSVTIPAGPGYVHVLRAVAASVAARLPMSLDEVDDLRLAVDEAAGRLLQIPETSRLTVGVQALAEGLEITVACDGVAETWPEPDAKATLPWKILTALAERVRFERRDGVASIRFVKRAQPLEVRA